MAILTFLGLYGWLEDLNFKAEASEINALGRLSVEKGLQMAAPQANAIEADFVGVQLGDANGDWSPKKIKAPPAWSALSRPLSFLEALGVESCRRFAQVEVV